MAAMANDPSIEEILASLDKLLEDSDIGNDDATASAADSDAVTETPDDDMLDIDVLLEEPEASGADSEHGDDETVDALDPHTIEPDDSEQNAVAMDAAMDSNIDEDDLNQELAANTVSVPLQGDANNAGEHAAAEPFEADLAAAVQAFNRGEQAAEKASATIDRGDESASEVPEEMVDEHRDAEAVAESPVLSEPSILPEAPAFPETMDKPDTDAQTESGTAHNDLAADAFEVSAFAGSEAMGDEADVSPDAVPVERSDTGGDITEPEESLPEQASIQLTAEQEVADDLSEAVAASVEDGHSEPEAVAPDEPMPTSLADESSAMAVDQANADRPPTAASAPHANIVVLSEDMLIDDHQNPLPFDRGIHGNADVQGDVATDASDKPASVEESGFAEEPGLAEEELPTSMPDALIEAISDKVVRQIEASLPALIEAGVQKAMKKAQKKHVRKKKSGKK